MYQTAILHLEMPHNASIQTCSYCKWLCQLLAGLWLDISDDLPHHAGRLIWTSVTIAKPPRICQTGTTCCMNVPQHLSTCIQYLQARMLTCISMCTHLDYIHSIGGHHWQYWPCSMAVASCALSTKNHYPINALLLPAALVRRLNIIGPVYEVHCHHLEPSWSARSPW